jgi:hypothetical protein
LARTNVASPKKHKDDPPPGAKEMPFLLGLDMMKRHLCQIDLEKHVLRFRIGGGGGGEDRGGLSNYMEVPFLHEKDLDEEQGGTKGFNADQANARLEQLDSMDEVDESNENEHKKDGSGSPS